VTYDRRAILATWNRILRADEATLVHEPLAVLGDTLALCRMLLRPGALAVDDIAPFDPVVDDMVALIEVDAQGRRSRTELFDEHQLGDGLARLYERYAESLRDSRMGSRAASTARALAAVLGPFELERYATGIADDVEFVDHRTVAFPSGRGRDELLRSVGTLLDTGDDVATRVDDVLAARPDALLLRWTTSGRDRLSHGPFEWQFLRLLVFADHGLLIRAEQFDVDRDAEALARFDAPADRPAHMTNAAMRSLARTDAGVQVLATRGEHLALARGRSAGGGRDVGSRGGESLLVLEVDDRGDRVALITFEGDELEAAYAALDERYAATAAADQRRAAVTRTFTRAFAERDWETLATVLAPDLVVTDHRLLGWEVLRGPAAYVEALRSLVELAPNVQLRIDHIRMASPGFLYLTTWLGTREGGAFEAPSAIVCEIDDAGRIRRFDQYDLDHLDEARAHLGRVGGGAGADRLGARPGTKEATRP
jgi:SnoaL-like domain